MADGRWWACAVALLVSGCVGQVTPGGPGAAMPGRDADSAAVVALVDSGINPYHEVFRTADEPPARVMAAGPAVVDLSFRGSWNESFAADEGFWGGVELGRLYWFRGTRVLGIALSDPALEQPLLDTAFQGHGTGTSAAVLARDPGAWVVMVEVGSRRTESVWGFDPSFVVGGIRWAVEQPWVDVLSVSLGVVGGAPVDGFEPIPVATERAVLEGKVVVAGIGNDATPSVVNQISGPPWVVKAGGVVPEQRGETVLASKAPDFVGDFVVRAACHRSVDELCDYLGTSFSAPVVAGSFARAVREVREGVGHRGGIREGALVDAGGVRVTNAEVREAFNRSAVYWNATDYRPGVPPPPGDVFSLVEFPFRVAQPVGPAPWTQMGWGYVPPMLAVEVAAVLRGGAGGPEKPAAALAYMAAVDEARREYWARQGSVA